MLVKDEGDIIEATVTHLLRELDQVYVADNGSTDGTSAILLRLRNMHGNRLYLESDDEVAYRQAEKTTRLAHRATAAGHSWVVPVDADEIWYSPFGRLGDVLEALPGDFLFAHGAILNHVGTELDPDDGDPVRRLGWRILEPGALPKVACRALEGLHVEMGNHGAFGRGPVSSRSPSTIDGQVYIHHYPWRSEEQFLRKITNGARAYAAAPEMGEDVGAHWRAFGMPDDDGFEERVRDWYLRWGRRWGNPPQPIDEDEDLVYDPAPVGGGGGTW